MTKITKGGRPSRPAGLSDNVIWKLVERCWHGQPQQRPTAVEVVSALQPIAHPQGDTRKQKQWDESFMLDVRVRLEKHPFHLLSEKTQDVYVLLMQLLDKFKVSLKAFDPCMIVNSFMCRYQMSFSQSSQIISENTSMLYAVLAFHLPAQRHLFLIQLSHVPKMEQLVNGFWKRKRLSSVQCFLIKWINLEIQLLLQCHMIASAFLPIFNPGCQESHAFI